MIINIPILQLLMQLLGAMYHILMLDMNILCMDRHAYFMRMLGGHCFAICNCHQEELGETWVIESKLRKEI